VTATATETTAKMKAEKKKQPEPVAEPESGEFEAILPEGGRVEIEPGLYAEVSRLKTREFLLLMRVITRGLGESFATLRFSTNDPDEMQQELLAMLMLAIPNAIEEFGAFLLAIVKPVSESERPNVVLAAQNPDPDVLVDILGTLVEQEAADLQALVGKARAWLARLQKTLVKERTATG
jgi:hypothetical protein